MAEHEKLKHWPLSVYGNLDVIKLLVSGAEKVRLSKMGIKKGRSPSN